MSYKNDSELVIMNRYGGLEGNAKAEMFETYDRIRDLAVSGPTLGASGAGKFASFLMNLARAFGSTAFLPTFGSEAITIPGTSFFQPPGIGGTGITSAGQAAFGLAPFSQASGFVGGGAAPLWNASALGRGNGLLRNGGSSLLGTALLPAASAFASLGIGALGNVGLEADASDGLGGYDFVHAANDATNQLALRQGTIAGGASPIQSLGNAGALAAGGAAAAGFGRNWVMPAAGIASGIGGLLTTFAPFFGPFGLAGAAAGAILNGASGAALASFQRVSNQLLVNADNILSSKVVNLETVVKMLGAQQDVVKKMLKDSIDGDKKVLENV
jgi:hypothetical protein